MRFLHTADWHVGKPLRGRSRMDEYARALGQVAGIAVDRKVDAVLVAGDVFDSPAPPPEAEKLVYDFLARLVSERIACVLIAGNHDHPRKLGALASLLEGLQDPRTARGAAARPGRRRHSRLARREGRSKDRGPAVRPGAKGGGRLHGDGRRAQVVRRLREAHRGHPGRAREGPPGHHRQHRPRAPPGGRCARRHGGARAAPRPGLRCQPPAAPVDGPVHRAGPPPPPAGGPGPREDPLSRLPDRARLRRAGAGEERRRPRRASPAAARHRARADHGGTTAAHGRGDAGRPAAPRGREKRRLPARPGEGRSPHARPRRPRQGAAPERPRRDGGPPSRRRRTTRARQGPRQARPRPALRCLLRAPEPDPAAEGAAAALRPLHEEAAK